MKKVAILDMPEDLLEDDLSKSNAKTKSIKPTAPIKEGKQPSSQITIDGLMKEVAHSLDLDPQELSEWVNDHSVPTEVLKLILRTAKRFTLNPLLGHIAWEFTDENRWEVYIPIDGWIALIHQEPTFQGIAFDQAAELENGIPIWMECTIYCSDLTQPLTVREYFSELKTDHPMWIQMPRRMLRHKTLQQCARLAFGISVPELTIPMALTTSPTSPASSNSNMRMVPHPGGIRSNPKTLLKHKLTSLIPAPAIAPIVPSAP